LSWQEWRVDTCVDVHQQHASAPLGPMNGTIRWHVYDEGSQALSTCKLCQTYCWQAATSNTSFRLNIVLGCMFDATVFAITYSVLQSRAIVGWNSVNRRMAAMSVTVCICL
jgi:hypothetical protein